MMKMLRKKRKGGFTLIELIVVIAILGILALIAIPRFATIQDNARIKADEATAAGIVSAAKIYIADNNLTGTNANAVKVTNLVGAKLIDAQPKSQQNNANMEITIDVGANTWSVTDGTWTKLY